jgi:hypothetical protein
MAYNCENLDEGIKFWEDVLKKAIVNTSISSYERNKEITEITNTISELKKQKVICSKDPIGYKCSELKAKIDSLISLIASEEKNQLSGNVDVANGGTYLSSLKKQLADAKLEFETNGCEAKLLDVKFQDTKNVIAEYSALDQARIDAETTYQKNKKIFLGVMVLLVGLFVVVSKKSE